MAAAVGPNIKQFHSFREWRPYYLDLIVCEQTFRITHVDKGSLEICSRRVEHLTEEGRQKLKDLFLEQIGTQPFPLIENPEILIGQVEMECAHQKFQKQINDHVKDINGFFDFLEILQKREAEPEKGNYAQEAALRNFLYGERDPHFCELFYAGWKPTVEERRQDSLKKCLQDYLE